MDGNDQTTQLPDHYKGLSSDPARTQPLHVRTWVMDVPSMSVFASIPVDEERLAELCNRYGIAELSVFGSTVRGQARPDSDLDLLYVLVPGRHLGFSINRLEDELTELFGRRVDLVSKEGLHRTIRDEVLDEARLLYAA